MHQDLVGIVACEVHVSCMWSTHVVYMQYTCCACAVHVQYKLIVSCCLAEATSGNGTPEGSREGGCEGICA